MQRTVDDYYIKQAAPITLTDGSNGERYRSLSTFIENGNDQKKKTFTIKTSVR